MSYRFCEYCNGSGTVQLSNELKICGNCNGTGVIKAKKPLNTAITPSSTEVALKVSVMKLQAEVERLKRGDFTPEEFQNLCHNKDEKNECTFKLGCVEYWIKLGWNAELPDRITTKQEEALIILFQDICDYMDGGGKEDLQRLKEDYDKLLKEKPLRDLYGTLVDERHREVLGDE